METVLITGASRGIGLELVRQFLQKGFAVLATHRGAAPVELTSLLSRGELELFELDVTDSTSIAELSKSLSNSVIDILINNAGVLGPEKQGFDALEPEAWLEVFAVNSVAPLMVSRALLEPLRRSERPRLLAISSQMGSLQRESTGLLAYGSSKAALNKVMQVLALELKPHGVTVCPIHPGWVRTDMGGADADLAVQQSADGIIELATKLGMEQSGRFFTWSGEEHPW